MQGHSGFELDPGAARAGHRGRFALAGGIAVFALLLAGGVAGSPLLAAALGAGIAGTALVLWRPFAGVVLLVFGSQLVEAIRAAVPGGGEWVLEGVAALTIGGILIHAYREPRHERLAPDIPAMRWAVLFVLALGLSTLFAEDRALALTGLRKELSVVILFYLVVRMVSTTERVRWIVAAILLSTCISAGLGIASFAGGTRLARVSDTTDTVRQAGGTADPLMSSQMMLAGAALGAILATRSGKWRAAGLATTALGFGGIVFTFARSTALVLALMIAWFVWKHRKKKWLLLLAVGVALAGVIVAAALPDTFRSRFSALSDPSKDWTLERRIGYHVIALDLFSEHPILGVGPRNFQEQYVDPKYRWVPGRTLEPRDLHNMYLAILVENGVVGFAAFAALLGAALVGLRRTLRATSDPEIRILAEAIQFAFVGYLIACATVPAQTSKYTWILAAMAAALGRADRFLLPRSVPAAAEAAAAPLSSPTPSV